MCYKWVKLLLNAPLTKLQNTKVPRKQVTGTPVRNLQNGTETRLGEPPPLVRSIPWVLDGTPSTQRVGTQYAKSCCIVRKFYF